MSLQVIGNDTAMRQSILRGISHQEVEKPRQRQDQRRKATPQLQARKERHS